MSTYNKVETRLKGADFAPFLALIWAKLVAIAGWLSSSSQEQGQAIQEGRCPGFIANSATDAVSNAVKVLFKAPLLVLSTTQELLTTTQVGASSFVKFDLSCIDWDSAQLYDPFNVLNKDLKGILTAFRNAGSASVIGKISADNTITAHKQFSGKGLQLLISVNVGQCTSYVTNMLYDQSKAEGWECVKTSALPLNNIEFSYQHQAAMVADMMKLNYLIPALGLHPIVQLKKVVTFTSAGKMQLPAQPIFHQTTINAETAPAEVPVDAEEEPIF